MPALDNLTPFAAADFLSITRLGEECLVIVVAGRFVLPWPGRPTTEPLRPCDEQSPPTGSDTYTGEPATSSLKYEGCSAYTRPRTDVLLSGRAWAPRGRRATTTTVMVRVGPLAKRAQVCGARVWRQGVGGLVPSSPEPFESVPLQYELGFGGTEGSAFEPRNPVGIGLYESSRTALERPLPFVEDPAALVGAWSDRPPPCGFGPVARSWQPRLALAGTYDAAWLERRAPLWPDDFDERFFQCAPAGMQASPHLRGGEPAVLEGVSPDGAFSFPLPAQRLVARCTFSGRSERKPMTLDAVHFEPDDRRVQLLWRATFSAHRELARHARSTVRLLEPWESVP